MLLKQLRIDGGTVHVPETHRQDSEIGRLVDAGTEHEARDLFGDAVVDDWFRAEGWNPDAIRGTDRPERAPATGDRTPIRLGRCPAKGCAHRTRRDDHKSVAECPDHGTYRLSPVYGAYTDTRCDRRCTGATGHICDCSCGGHNHGREHG